ncbi:hypothetical protein CP973_19440 [Streptomyces albofaciens JCM 4342]|uniref:hypothetical protein n=1 Tax=Streptomyces albofaciens TaxID=66866 RepID=UPI000B271042|nr:hypothetical protein [Streptomyces albofaciens]KAA6223806.1 hypothetical protein CP973_19440 [Streptomyces albofaciens JCM 4342]
MPISHSPRSTVLIHLLEGGRIAETGTFTEPVGPATAPGGRFLAVYEIQRAQFATGDEHAVPLQEGSTAA